MHRFLPITLFLGFLVALAAGHPHPPTQVADPTKPAQTKAPDPAPAQEQEESADPYQSLKDRVDSLKKTWIEARKEADENIPKFAKDNPCSRRIAPLILKEREAFKAYNEADDLYVRKQGEDILEDLTRFSKAKADNQSVALDYNAEIAKVETDLKDDKAKMASLPTDDPFYNDAREQIAKNIQINEDNIKNLKAAQTSTSSRDKHFEAAAAYIDSRKRYVESMKLQIETLRIEMLAQYDDEASQWTERCSKSKGIRH